MTYTKEQLIELLKENGFIHRYDERYEFPNIITKDYGLVTFSTDDRSLDLVVNGEITLSEFITTSIKLANHSLMEHLSKKL
jgi:hypothetical protein